MSSTHKPVWAFHTPANECEVGWWEDLNQPDSDQFSGTTEDWLAALAHDGVHPPKLAVS
jgi:hypothetical protein